MDSSMLSILAAVFSGLLGLAATYYWRARPAQRKGLPAKMRALVLVQANANIAEAKLEVQEVDVPKPKSGQVLVKIAASPMNPSDDGLWKMEPKNGYPLRLGNEGSGVVVATGGGLYARSLMGQNVGVVRGTPTWSEYAVVDALQGAFPLPPSLPVEDCCSFFVNPFSAVGIVETALKRGSPGLVHTAAASQLGQMLVKYCKRRGVQLVNVVSRAEQKELLESLGAEYVVVTAKDDWQEELQRLVDTLKITVAFDAVAGEMTGTILSLLPPFCGSTVFVYGGLSGQGAAKISPLDLIYRKKHVEGFLLPNFLMKGGMLEILRRVRRVRLLVNERLADDFASEFKDTSLGAAHGDYTSGGRTGGKWRIRPGAGDAAAK